MVDPFEKLRAALAAPPDLLAPKRSKRRVQSLIEKAGDSAVVLNACHYQNFCSKYALSSSRSDGLSLAVRFNARKAHNNAPASRSDA
jgi:hypothetical protein